MNLHWTQPANGRQHHAAFNRGRIDAAEIHGSSLSCQRLRNRLPMNLHTARAHASTARATIPIRHLL